MKKIAIYQLVKLNKIYSGFLSIYDSTDYIKIKEHYERISDKYVSITGFRFNKRPSMLIKGNIIIRQLYYIFFNNDIFNMYYYDNTYYKNFSIVRKPTDELNNSLNTKNSIKVNFNKRKQIIILLFSNKIKIRKDR